MTTDEQSCQLHNRSLRAAQPVTPTKILATLGYFPVPTAWIGPIGGHPLPAKRGGKEPTLVNGKSRHGQDKRPMPGLLNRGN